MRRLGGGSVEGSERNRIGRGERGCTEGCGEGAGVVDSLTGGELRGRVAVGSRCVESLR